MEMEANAVQKQKDRSEENSWKQKEERTRMT
jgi:hypothetical protein